GQQQETEQSQSAHDPSLSPLVDITSASTRHFPNISTIRSAIETCVVSPPAALSTRFSLRQFAPSAHTLASAFPAS
ncbi:MAG: hypothetical protein WBE90_23520, partial [Xanthobacteraceae bacterium]